MGLEQHTPDATQGAIVAANGYVTVPDDNEELKGSAIASPVEQTLDLMAFLTGGPTNDPDYKITGNGVPPAGGYTPETNPVWIKGKGLRVTFADPQDQLYVQGALKFNRTSGAVSDLDLSLAPDDEGSQTIYLKPNQAVTEVVVQVDASIGAAMPDVRVKIHLRKRTFGVETTVLTLEDPLTDLASYRTTHQITMPIPGGEGGLVGTFSYSVGVTGESGANAETVLWNGSRVDTSLTEVSFK